MECQDFDVKHGDPLSVSGMIIQSQDIKCEIQTEAENCVVKHETYVDPHVVASSKVEIPQEHVDTLLSDHDQSTVLSIVDNGIVIEGEKCADLHGEAGNSAISYRLGSLFTMKCNTECEQFDIKHEENPLSASEVKIEKPDIKSEIQTENEEYDVKCETYADPLVITSSKIISEVKESRVMVDKLMCRGKASQVERKNKNNDQANALPVIDDKYGLNVPVCDAAAEKAKTLRLFNNSVFASTKFKEMPLKYFKCDICVKIFPDKDKFRNHMYIHGGKHFTCNFCSKSFSRKSPLDIHIRTHFNERPFTCNFCSKSFTVKSSLNSHIRIHLDQKPFSCDYCSKSFTIKFTLIKHIRTHTNEKPFSCNICSKSFNQKVNLSQHIIRTHTNEKPFICNFCNKSFNDRSSLNRHIRNHTNVKQFSCSYCSKSFNNSSNMRRHIRTHTNEKPYSCTKCSKSFSDKSNLRQHLSTHTCEKPYSCSICGRAFTMKRILNSHMRTHTNEKPFSCNFCSKSFSTKFGLVIHIRNHTKETPLLCSFCNKSFSDETNLNRHKETHISPYLCK